MKSDSVFLGHILDEIDFVLKATSGKTLDQFAKRAIVAALANASRRGIYVLTMVARVFAGAEARTGGLALVAEVFWLH